MRKSAAKLYAEGKVTFERAAMDADVSVREMMEYLRQRKIPAQRSYIKDEVYPLLPTFFLAPSYTLYHNRLYRADWLASLR
jgi:hypothetical protein